MKKASGRVSKGRPIKAEDLFKLRIPTSVSISPDETKIAYSVERMDRDKNKYFSNIFICDLTTGESHQFTYGDHGDRQPVWSANGEQLAFISTRDKKTGIYLIASTGGAEKKLMEVEGSIGNLNWTPDHRYLVFCLRYNDSHFIKDEKQKKKPPVYRHITRLWYRLDAEGYLPKDRYHIYKFEIQTGKLTKLTRSQRDHVDAAVSPDGRWVAYVSNRSKDPDIELLREDLFVCSLKDGKERRIPTPAGPLAAPVFSPDSKTIAYVGHDNPDDDWGGTNSHIWKVGVNGRPRARNLMPKYDRSAYDQSICDTSDAHGAAAIFWSADSKRIYFVSSDTGNTNILYLPSSGGKPTRVFSGKCHVKGFSLNGKGKTVALIHADINNPGEIMACPSSYGGEKRARKLTTLNSFLKTEVRLGITRDLMFKSFDGTELQGWLVYPPNFSPNRKYRSILQIHGGPRVQYAHTFFHEMQYLAARNYVVFYTNPRGGSGRGETWARAISGGWGELDYMDCMAAADYLEKQKFINRKKMGVTGGSYGGYMTNWIIGHTNRFKAAVTQRSVVELKSFYGTSDIGWSLSREFDGHPWKNPDNYEKCSPLTYFKNIKTPVLIIHSENDMRCNVEQAEQMFAMLKVMKKTVEMVRFPEEPHGLSRHGRPDRRVARLEWIARWFDKYLK
ncbi:MAG: S9 family peptidase [Candidatus Zixiibacteriota bacterium]|nr:MAG: S9 family peptidase [candidate division Zixibacteria bacterium]